MLCSAKGRSPPLPSAPESAVFRSAPLQSTAVRFRRRRGAGEAAIDWQSSMKPACCARGSACRAERIQPLPPPVRRSISGPLVVQTLRTFVDDDRAFRLWLRHSSECGGWSPGRLTEVAEWLRSGNEVRDEVG